MSRLKKAMQRAREARESQRPSTVKEREQLVSSAPASAQPPKVVRVKYSKTRVHRTDRDQLRENKILSLFSNQKTTTEIEMLRTQVLTKLQKTGGNSLLVTSAHPGEGKTFTSINLGVSIAQQLDKTVLIVDCDLRNPWKRHFDFSSDFFGIHIREGLADYLQRKVALEDIILNPGIEKLTIIPGGRPLPNSAELLSSNRMKDLVVELKTRYQEDRIVIFDSPALLACTDPLVFSDAIDGVILVVQAERTSPEEIKRVTELLKDRNLLGTVLNKSSEQREYYV
jgi:non-specific protein-tyrosine kinase